MAELTKEERKYRDHIQAVKIVQLKKTMIRKAEEAKENRGVGDDIEEVIRNKSKS